MKWVLVFLAISFNILAGAAVYRVWVPSETPTVIDTINQKTLALQMDHVELERQHLTLYKQLTKCLGRAI